jgi:mono/diheme cytochrome c family protein
MHFINRLPIIFLALLLPAVPLLAQSEDVFSFIPPGGRTILAQLIEKGLPADELETLVSEQRSKEEWNSYLSQRSRSLSALTELNESELKTLADYLSFNAPLGSDVLQKGPAKTIGQTLPKDGRDLALEYCQSCHIITVTVTQDRTKEHWLGTMNKPSHVGVKLSPQEREALASYLVLNAAIPIDQVPKELRAGGASY